MNKQNMHKQGLYDPWYEHDSCGVGFVVDVKGRKSHKIVEQALTVLLNLRHRGACGCEANTGDGAGILLQVPHAFLKDVCSKTGVKLPGPKEYGVGMVFLPPNVSERSNCEKIFEEIRGTENPQEVYPGFFLPRLYEELNDIVLGKGQQ